MRTEAIISILLIFFLVGFAQPKTFYGKCPEGYMMETYVFGKSMLQPRGQVVVQCYATGRETILKYKAQPPDAFKNYECERLWYQCEGGRGYTKLRHYCHAYDSRCT